MEYLFLEMSKYGKNGPSASFRKRNSGHLIKFYATLS